MLVAESTSYSYGLAPVAGQKRFDSYSSMLVAESKEVQFLQRNASSGNQLQLRASSGTGSLPLQHRASSEAKDIIPTAQCQQRNEKRFDSYSLMPVAESTSSSYSYSLAPVAEQKKGVIPIAQYQQRNRKKYSSYSLMLVVEINYSLELVAEPALCLYSIGPVARRE